MIKDCKILEVSLAEQVDLLVKKEFGENYRASSPGPSNPHKGGIHLLGGEEAKFPYEYEVGEWYIRNQQVNIVVYKSRLK